MQFNKIILAGNLTRDAKLEYSKNGTAVCPFSIAVNYGNGDRQETFFIDVNLFGKTAENICRYLLKGTAVLVDGQLKQESWTGRDGAQKSKFAINASGLQLVGKRDPGDNTQNAYSNRDSRVSRQYTPPPTRPAIENNRPEDDIPF